MSKLMDPLGFMTFQSVSQAASKRKIVFFAAGITAEKTAMRLHHDLAFIVDNNPNLWGTRQLGVDVIGPANMSAPRYDKAQHFILICTTSFVDVAAQLTELGLVAGTDFAVSPILNDLRVISDLESIEVDLLFTSGLPEETSPNYGGGIYKLCVKADLWSYKKLHSGTTYDLIKHRDSYIAVDDKYGLVEFDQDFNIIRHNEFELGTRAHGIAYSAQHHQYYVVASYMDRVLIFDEDFKPQGHIAISHKYETTGRAAHHCNDICVIGDSLYVSMFSYTGNFRNDVFDGVVLEIDIPSQQILGPVITDLWMPHSISTFNGCLTVLNSLPGQLLQNNAQEIGNFPGFTRGLDYDGVYYYIGQSKNRNYSKTFGISKNISIDTAVIIFDEHTKASRSIQLPPKVSEIHTVLIA